MSKYEWEKGSIVVPYRQWPGFRSTILRLWENDRRHAYDTYCRLRKEVMYRARGLRGQARKNAMEKTVLGDVVAARAEELQREMVWRICRTDRTKKMVRADFDLPVQKTQDRTMWRDDWSLSLTNASRTILWSVEENNHAVDHAHNDQFVKKVFRLLDNIVWTRGSGGVIFGNDEYNRDAWGEGEGGNYVTRHYGPEGKKRLTRPLGI